MSRTYIAILTVVIAAILAYFFFPSNQETRVTEEVAVENNNYSISFNYLSGEDGYELIESNTSDNFLHSYVIVEKSALAEYQANQVTTAPPTVSIFIFQLPEEEESDEERAGRVTRLQNWAQENAGLTSFTEIYGTPDVVEVDGVKALQYSTDGVYQQTIYLVSYRGFVYMFVGQYDRPTDFIKGDFESLMASVRFE